MSDMTPKRAKDTEVVMTQLILPPDANNLNAAFGGKVMEWIDICGAVAAQRHCRQVVVTASMDDLHFHAPIKVGWIALLHSRVLAAFRTSMEVGVTVHAENPLTGERTLTTSALLTFVAIDKDGSRVPVPPLLMETDTERESFREAEARRAQRLARQKENQSWLKVMQPIAGA
ncbi:acyl-CoA thioesterase [Myxococcus sp. CA051A]|uniref:Acyl-CoA thioesterase n=1 Tax=Myxococcus llanfairpwllgwyngyllgogerychwyrndrobwllllantysiliogogogochensis TaxID=2590453 RepID=A0A540WIX2_9BACT|nr:MULTISPECIES: acyl-CoA thioesterase [Myxococcus]NTX04135.1 acyl-CoA thioesterase [Myxococcus sp. CA040A]NTX13257.1 acyl-CoA thioesterase [Myxococcus sp. CA056]NTX36291.1 acyl-CoA thioesterase [Myxococcus sp. CA033]NTX58785.1 acyl-CoA thioesterase [Myxococcus sp. CA039A]NTX61717.1 acyl-CoA thioesterase [Myxococcus sp. CA051A]